MDFPALDAEFSGRSPGACVYGVLVALFVASFAHDRQNTPGWCQPAAQKFQWLRFRVVL